MAADRPVDSIAATGIAPTAQGLHDLLAARRSTRAFDAAHALDDATLSRLLEAARWAPSANNVQPWRFVVAPRGTRTFERLFTALAPGNRVWAGAASALVLAVAQVRDDQGNERPWAGYDLGQAVAHLSVQAQAEGLDVHQMGGFDAAAAAGAFGLGADLRPMVVVAIGRHAPHVELPSPYAERERAPRTRRPLSELVITPQPDTFDSAGGTHVHLSRTA
jgi:nitroreductase